MGLKKAENQVKMLIGDTIVALCRNTLNHHAEVNVEGILGITLDNEEIFLVNINQTITNSEGASRNKDEALKRTASSNDKNDKSSSEDSSSEDSGDQSDSSPKRKRRRRHRKKRQSLAPGDKDTSACADGLQLIPSGQRHSKASENATIGINTNSMVSTECTGLSNVDQNAASYSQVTFTQSIIENVAQTDSNSSHSNNAQVPSGSSSMLQASCMQPNSAPNVIVTTNPSANFDTGQNGIMNVKQEILPDDENDEDLVIIKEEMDSEHPSPVLVFPNVSQTFHGDSILMGTPAHQQSFIPSTSQSASTSSPMPGTSGFTQSTASWHSRSSHQVETLKRPNDPGPSLNDDFQVNVQFKLDLLLGMVGDLQQQVILNSGTPEQLDNLMVEPCNSVEELEGLSCRLEIDKTFKQRMVQSLASIGGQNGKDCFRRMARRLGTDELWSKYSMYGRKGKRCFKELGVCRVIVQAALQASKDSKTSESDVEEWIMEHLRHAPFRFAKRNKIPEVTLDFDIQEL